MEPPSVQYLRTSDGYDIAYSIVGEGLPLVFLPIVFSHLQAQWNPHSPLFHWFERFAAQFRLIRYDARGQGLSTRGLPEQTSLFDLDRDLEELAEHLGLNRFVLMGQSVTAHLAVRYALQHPDRLSALVLLNSSVANNAWPSGQWQLLPSQNWDWFLLRASAPLGSSREEVQRMVELLKLTITQSDWVIRQRPLLLSNLTEALPQLRTPTLILHPRDFLGLAVEEAAKLASRIQASRLVLLDGDDYFGDPEQGVRAIESFLADLPAVPEASPVVPDRLSAREVEVLRLLAAGKSNPEIAKELFITRNTVQNHVSSILIKTNLANRAQAAVYARDHGIA